MPDAPNPRPIACSRVTTPACSTASRRTALGTAWRAYMQQTVPPPGCESPVPLWITSLAGSAWRLGVGSRRKVATTAGAHLDSTPQTPEPAVFDPICVDCAAVGGSWLHLRRCLDCGDVFCCDS